MKIKEVGTLLVSSVLIAFIAGCGGVKTSMILAPEAPLDSINGIESVNLNSANVKIVLLEGKHRNIISGLQSDFRDKVEEIITESGSEVVDRDLASKLMDEIGLGMMSDKENLSPYEGPKVADFVVTTKLTKSSLTTNYTAASRGVTDKGTYYTIPSSCSYGANVKGKIVIRLLPSLKRLDVINVKGASTVTGTGESRRCNNKNNMTAATLAAVEDTMLKGANDYLVIAKHLGARGAITGARKLDETIYLETNLGRIHGAKDGLEVKIYQYVGKELAFVSDAKILDNNNIFQEKSYLKIDQDKLYLIKKGMVVKISGDCSGLKCAGAWFKDLTQ